VVIIRLVLCTSSVLDVVTIAFYTLHDAVDGARVTVLAIVVQAKSKLPLFALAMALVDVAVSVAAAPVLVKVGA
jgi:hypothetical protein